MENVSLPIIILFLLAVLITVWLFFRASNYSKAVVISISAYGLIQTILGIVGFYTRWDAMPPRFPLLILPGVIAIIVMFLIPAGRKFIDSLNIEHLTILHTIRIPIEISLYYLLMANLIPRSMTFEGSNFDIISGISAPVIYYFVFIAKKANQWVLLVWNIICMVLLLNVVITAILAAKTPLQQIAFDQPNIGVTYFPFVLLPAVVVPIVLFSHLASIRQIVIGKQLMSSSLIL